MTRTKVGTYPSTLAPADVEWVVGYLTPESVRWAMFMRNGHEANLPGTARRNKSPDLHAFRSRAPHILRSWRFKKPLGKAISAPMVMRSEKAPREEMLAVLVDYASHWALSAPSSLTDTQRNARTWGEFDWRLVEETAPALVPPLAVPRAKWIVTDGDFAYIQYNYWRFEFRHYEGSSADEHLYTSWDMMMSSGRRIVRAVDARWGLAICPNQGEWALCSRHDEWLRFTHLSDAKYAMQMFLDTYPDCAKMAGPCAGALIDAELPEPVRDAFKTHWHVACQTASHAKTKGGW